MNDPDCRVLLICDDDLGGLELRKLLGRELRAHRCSAQGEVRSLPLASRRWC